MGQREQAMVTAYSAEPLEASSMELPVFGNGRNFESLSNKGWG